MNIAIDVRSLMEGRHSGIEEYTTQIIQNMAEIAPGHHFFLFYNAAKKVDIPRFSGNVSYVGFRYPNKILNASQWVLKQPRWDKLVKADVFFVPNPRLIPLSEGVPLVSVVHDLSFEYFPEFLDIRRRLWHRIIEPKTVFKRSKSVIAVSEHTKRDVVRKYGLDQNKVQVVYSGVKAVPKITSLQLEKARKKYALPKEFILYLGTLEPRKNVAGLIKAYSLVAASTPFDLVIAGERGWRQKEVMQALAQSSVKDRVHLIGFVEEEDKSSLYALAGLFVYPSFYEGFGFPPLEALLSGTPVITSYNSSLPEVVGQWATLIDPYNINELAVCIKELSLDLPTVSDEMKKTIRRTYSWSRAARKTLEIIEKAASDSLV